MKRKSVMKDAVTVLAHNVRSFSQHVDHKVSDKYKFKLNLQKSCSVWGNLNKHFVLVIWQLKIFGISKAYYYTSLKEKIT